MAASERVVVLMTPEQKELVVKRARAAELSVSDYVRRQALDNDELLDNLLVELRASTAAASESLERAIAKLHEAEAKRAEVDARTYARAVAEFADLDPDAFARLVR